MGLEQRLFADIRSFFDDEFAVTLGDLQKPTYVFVRDFYARVLIEFGVDTDNVRKASHMIAGMDTDSVEITSDVNLVAAINQTFTFLNFGLFDLLSPGDKARRSITMMANVMEFVSDADELTSQLDFESYNNFRVQICNDVAEVEETKQKLSRVALEKDGLAQRKIEFKNERARLKPKLQQLCVEVSEVEKVAKECESRLEERRAVLTSSSAEEEKMRQMVERVREELVFADTLKSREEAKELSEMEKNDFHDKYLQKTALLKQYTEALEMVKRKAAHLREMADLFSELRDQQEELAATQKVLAELKLVKSAEHKEEAARTSEVAALEESLRRLKRDVESITEDLDAKQKKHSSKLAEMMRAINAIEATTAADRAKLDALKDKAASQQQQFLECVEKFKSLLKERILCLE